MTKLYVGNLSWSTNDQSLKAAFAQYGEVATATVMVDKMTGRSRGFGFVEMNPADAQNAINGLNGTALDGREIIVNEARPREEGASAGGPRRSFGGGNRQGGQGGGFGGGMRRF